MQTASRGKNKERRKEKIVLKKFCCVAALAWLDRIERNKRNKEEKIHLKYQTVKTDQLVSQRGE